MGDKHFIKGDTERTSKALGDMVGDKRRGNG